MQRRIPTGCTSLDKLLGGGLPNDGISLIYGEAETGKSSFAIQCAVNCTREGLKVIYIDSDGTFSSRRFSQIAYTDHESISPLIILVKPTTFQEQVQALDHLENYITKKVGLLVVDTITSLYRAELGDPKVTFALNREINRQVAYLAQIAASHRVATLITSQVRNVFVGSRANVEPVATRVLKFWSEVVLNFRSTGQTRTIEAVIEKHPRRKRRMGRYLTISEAGISDYGNGV